MTADIAVGPPPPPRLTVDRTTAPPPPPLPERLRPQGPSAPPEAGEEPLRGMPGAPEAERLRAQLRDPELSVTSFRDEASGHFVLQLTDRASGDVVDQYPPERLLRLFAAMREAGAAADGGLIDERA